MSYNSIQYYAVFLPAIIIIYQITKNKYRWLVLLIASYLFFYSFSKFLFVYSIATTVITYYTVKLLKAIAVNKCEPAEKKKKKLKRKKLLAVGIVANLLILLFLKYTNFIGLMVFSVLNKTGLSFIYEPLNILVPIGISYYTLQAIAYMVDVYRGIIEPQTNMAKLALYLCFFPTLVEGPITRYAQISKELYAGDRINYSNLTYGYQRILWGLFKKVVLADYMVIGVNKIFDSGIAYDGSVYLFGAVLCTLQLYMDFSGTIDIVIGSAKIFDVTLPENFRQPFFAKNAGDFWRRWHITLGAWLKDYVFYPISFSGRMNKITKKLKRLVGSNASKMFTPTVALLCVWLCNGLWHGPKLTYIFYGLYYFVIIFIELRLEKPFEAMLKKIRLDEKGKTVRVFRFVKLFIIVIIGEMLFRADTLELGFSMLKSIFTDFHITAIIPVLSDFVREPYDYLVMLIGTIIVFISDVLCEKSISVSEWMNSRPKGVRWLMWYVAIFVVIIFGAYGPGFDTIAMMYAAF